MKQIEEMDWERLQVTINEWKLANTAERNGRNERRIMAVRPDGRIEAVYFPNNWTWKEECAFDTPENARWYLSYRGNNHIPGIMNTHLIQEVPEEALDWLIDKWTENEDVGKVRVLAKTEFGYTAIDNSTDDCWVESFGTEEKAIAWLNREFEVGEEDG